MTETLAHGYSSEFSASVSYPMNTNTTGFQSFLKTSLHPSALDESTLSTGRVKNYLLFAWPLRTGFKYEGLNLLSFVVTDYDCRF